jgi:metal-responsive CopG/Arc/MetJ family transcriptional regulator
MKPIQVVLDNALLRELDRCARQRNVSRSAFLRTALADALQRYKTAEQVERIREAYSHRPQTAEERRTAAALLRSQAAGARSDAGDW